MNFVKRHFYLLFAVSLAIVFAAVVWATSLPLGESIMLFVGVAAFWMLVFSIREDNELNRENYERAKELRSASYQGAPLFIRYYGLVLAILFTSALGVSAIVFGIPLGETILLGLLALALWATAWAEGPPHFLSKGRWPSE